MTLVRPTSLRGKQAMVAGGALTALAVTVLTFLHGLSGSVVPVNGVEACGRVAPYLAVPAVCLFAGIAAIANHRFFSAEAIDGATDVKAAGFVTNQHYLQNTQEQALLAAIVWLSFAAVYPGHAVALVPSLAVLFLVGRVCFWLGYRWSPPARAFGFGLTFYPTVAVMLWTLKGLVF
jgi:MAPEG family